MLARTDMIRSRPRSMAQQANLAALAMMIGLLGMLLVGFSVIFEIDRIAQNRQGRIIATISQAIAASELRSAIGVGSVMDQLRHFQLESDAATRSRLLESLMTAHDAIESYRSNGRISEHEAEDLTKLGNALTQIEAAATGAGFVPQSLEPALQSLNGLDKALSEIGQPLAPANDTDLVRLHWLAFGGGGLAILLLAALIANALWQMQRLVVTPIAGLLADTRRLAALQLDTPFTWPRQDELGELGRTLDVARRNLRDLLSENEEKSRRLAHQATHDPLTGLANRAKLIEWLSERLGTPGGSALALILLDIAGFQPGCDRHGPVFGQKLLRALATRLTDNLAPSERLVRFEGGRFALLVDLAAGETARSSAARLEAALAKPLQLDGVAVPLAPTLVIVTDDGHSGCAEDLLQHADQVFFRAKSAKRRNLGVTGA